MTETWLNDETRDSELGMNGFIIYRSDRSKDHCKKWGGGVLIAVKSTLVSREVLSITQQIEVLFVLIDAGNKSILLGVVYIPPNSSVELYEYFCIQMESIIDEYQSDFIVLCGDFNLPGVQWINDQYGSCAAGVVTRQATILSEVVSFQNFYQLNNVPNVMGNCLDLIFSDFQNINVNLVDEPIIHCDSYHPALCFSIPICHLLGNALNYSYEYFDFKSANYKLINDYLGLFEWDQIINVNDVNIAVDNFYNVINNAFKQFVPKIKSVTPRFPCWYSNELKEAILNKKIAHKTFKNSNLPEDYKIFVNLRKLCKDLSTQCYKDYICTMENSIKNDSKEFWKFVHQKNKNLDIPACMSYNGKTSDNPIDIVDFFADFFSSVYNNKSCNFKESPLSANLGISLCNIETMEVYNEIMNLNDKLGVGPDDISVIFLKNCACILSYVLCKIFNHSLLSGVFPEAWKLSYIVPLFKNGNKAEVQDYRAITRLSLISKLFESIVSAKLAKQLQSRLTLSQHGFVSGRSTVTNLLVYEQSLVHLMETKHQIDSIYTDFSKAFDKVNHEVLIIKLRAAGICGRLIDWFSSYLSDRYQAVLLKGILSRRIPITSGVPQGAHLSPLLFNIFINDIVKVIKHSQILLYADDLKIYRCIESVDDCEKIQDDLDNLISWCNLNGMEFNTKKCKVITFHRKSNIIEFKYVISGDILERVNSIKDLGVLFDGGLSFNEHVNFITSKALKLLGFVKRTLRDFTDLNCFKVLYCSYIRSVLEYACQVWSPYYQMYKVQIERVQRKFFRFVGFKLGIPMEQLNYLDIMTLLNLPPLEQRRVFLDLCMLYKIINSNVDCPVLLDYINLNVPQRNLRSNNIFKVKFHRTNYGLSSSLSRSCNEANRICNDVDMFNVLSLNSFKRQIGKRIFFTDSSLL